MTSTTHRLIIVGSGPSGYTAAIYAARAGLQPLVIAGALSAGGALMNTTDVENFPGFSEGIMGPDLMTQMQQQAERFGATIEWDDAVSLSLEGDIKTVVTDGGQTYTAPAIILALGSAYRELGYPTRSAYLDAESPGALRATASSSRTSPLPSSAAGTRLSRRQRSSRASARQ